MVDEKEAYRLLGLAPHATQAEVRAAFRRRVMEQHPDTSAGDDPDSSVQDLVDAYRLLVAPVTGRVGVKGARIPVRHGQSERERAPERRSCPACSGIGVRTELVSCPDCGGSSRVTTLEVDRARVSLCPTCRGQGRRTMTFRCEVCGGG